MSASKDPCFQEMRTDYTIPFLQNFNMGCALGSLVRIRASICSARYQNYSQGEWQVARSLLTKTHSMLSDKVWSPFSAESSAGWAQRCTFTLHGDTLWLQGWQRIEFSMGQWEAPDWWRGKWPQKSLSDGLEAVSKASTHWKTTSEWQFGGIRGA